MKPPAFLEKLKPYRMKVLVVLTVVIALTAGYLGGTKVASRGHGGSQAPGHGEGHSEAHGGGHDSGHVAAAGDNARGPAGHAAHEGSHKGSKEDKGQVDTSEDAAEESDEEATTAQLEATARHQLSGVAKVWAKYSEAASSIQDKVDTLRRLDEENRKLALENTHLRMRIESHEFDCRALEAARRSRDLELQLNRETGSRMGRALASISYHVPTGLLPHQLFTLALNYFHAREDEKAAVILTFLTGMENEDTFKTSQNFLFTGAAWYRLDNLVAANSYFDMVLKESKGSMAADSTSKDGDPTVQEQARLWKALVEERMGKHSKSQDWLREMLSYNPHSMEAGWVNGKEAKRGTASEK